MKKETVGAASLRAKADQTVYDPYEIGEALTNDILKNVWECIDAHYSKIDEPEFCVIMLRGPDPLIQNLERRKFYAWPYLPKPRPQQTVFHYDKRNDTILRLWSLPSARVMATLSETVAVATPWRQTKHWCDAFFHGFRWDKAKQAFVNKDPQMFYNTIRRQYNIDLETEHEYLKTHHAELVKSGSDEVERDLSDPFTFAKIGVKEIVNTQKVIS